MVRQMVRQELSIWVVKAGIILPAESVSRHSGKLPRRRMPINSRPYLKKQSENHLPDIGDRMMSMMILICRMMTSITINSVPRNLV